MQTIKDFDKYMLEALLENSAKKFKKISALKFATSEEYTYKTRYEKISKKVLASMEIKPGDKVGIYSIKSA